MGKYDPEWIGINHLDYKTTIPVFKAVYNHASNLLKNPFQLEQAVLNFEIDTRDDYVGLWEAIDDWRINHKDREMESEVDKDDGGFFE